VSGTDLSLADLERYGRIWGSSAERRALCPFCDHPRRDYAHATLAVNVDTGVWHCHRCDRSGLVEERRVARDDDPLRSGSRSTKRRRGSRQPKSAPSAPTTSTADEIAQLADKRHTLRRLWDESLPIADHAAAPGAAYLAIARSIPRGLAQAAQVRYHPDFRWKRDKPHTWTGGPSRGAVVFPMTRGGAVGIDLEARYIDTGTPKSRSTGKGGVFVALPGALEAKTVTLCEGPITALSAAAAGLAAVALGGQRWSPWLIARLAGRDVIIAFDEGEQATEAKVAALTAELFDAGARPFRLRLPAGDLNDRLKEIGLVAFKREVDAALSAIARGLEER